MRGRTVAVACLLGSAAAAQVSPFEGAIGGAIGNDVGCAVFAGGDFEATGQSVETMTLIEGDRVSLWETTCTIDAVSRSGPGWILGLACTDPAGSFATDLTLALSPDRTAVLVNGESDPASRLRRCG